MAIIQPTRKDIHFPQQIKKYSLSLRIWHWASALIITGSLITVLINATILDDHSTAMFLKAELQRSGAPVNDHQSQSVAHALSDKVWEVHTYFGYTLAALFLFRLILEFFQLADQKFIRKIKSAYQQYYIIKKERELARHELMVKLIYLAFYLVLTIMVITGLPLAFEDQLTVLKPIRHSIKDVHGFCMYLVIAFILVHLTGVLLAERKKDSKGIVSDMINGGNE